MKRSALSKSLEFVNREHQERSQESGDTASATTTSTRKPSTRAVQDISKTLSKFSAESAQEVDVADIADSEVSDRFDVLDGIEDLKRSIEVSGQKLPALLRYRTGPGKRYEVVYGRRRVAACRELGIKVRAFIREMDGREALLSQALENAARLERSFIEQAIFANKLKDQEFTRAEIQDALAVDKGTLSKMLGVTRDIPDEIIYRIGAAHDVGRRPWFELRELVSELSADEKARVVDLVPDTGKAAEKLTAVINTLAAKLRQPSDSNQAQKHKASKMLSLGNTPVSYKNAGKRIVVEVSGKQEQAFLEFLEDNLAELYDSWKTEQGRRDG
ncbi:plasmid partitioning protein RepB [Roseivivax sp. GX 12232]|uniref:plasmid partitioning protein RepB n=1 Tax=Roseivivax sp. GX 12232 TaxID=2900547 RepID=UPI001E5E9DEB|nr:plasmid partitioning protein RepB [Roseivivax sp. GX 12232]MCE0507275.1 plasmid partitioning protein RepB [Roseivivax sp. GX 12232]